MHRQRPAALVARVSRTSRPPRDREGPVTVAEIDDVARADVSWSVEGRRVDRLALRAKAVGQVVVRRSLVTQRSERDGACSPRRDGQVMRAAAPEQRSGPRDRQCLPSVADHLSGFVAARWRAPPPVMPFITHAIPAWMHGRRRDHSATPYPAALMASLTRARSMASPPIVTRLVRRSTSTSVTWG